MELRVAAAERAQDVLERGAARARHDGDALRVAWDGLFVGRIEQALGVQPIAQLAKRQLQCPDAARLHPLHVELVLPAGLVDVDGTGGEYLQSVV